MKSLNNLTEEFISLLKENNLLKPLIKGELIKNLLSKVIIEKNIEEETINLFLDKYGIKDKINYEEWLIKNKLTDTQLKNLALSDIRLKKYCMENFEHQVEARFIERKDKLDVFVYSLIRIKDFFKAKELYMRLISQEEEFGDLAKKYSEGVENRTRGVLGPLSLETTHPMLAEHLRTIKEGEIQPPIKIGDSHLIVRVESFYPAKLDDFMREKMVLEIFDQSIEAQVSELTNNILQKCTPTNKEGGV